MTDNTNKSNENYIEKFLAECCDERTFYKEADAYIKAHEERPFCVLAIEINNFRFFHLWYGHELSDRYLIDVETSLVKSKNEFGGVVGFFGGARFALCIPCDAEQIKTVRRRLNDCRRFQDSVVAFLPLLGICRNKDGETSSEVMYDRATIACDSVRANYTAHIAEYDQKIDERVREEGKMLESVRDIRRGLDENEFVFFLQPKCDMRTGKILGAEALVRWNHKKLGLISPDKFIPLLERAGLVSLIDRHVWEEVFAWQRRWIDAGHRPLPISMNVSRIDMLSFDVTDHIKSLAKKYSIEPRLIEIEITESTYAEDPTIIVNTIKLLKEAGFPMLMDDFGSGYSSLNVLRNINFDILKIDMKFLFKPDESNERKGVSILESVINMARLLDLPVIIEGIETAEQVRLLRDMGCRYAQGYYYYKPMLLEDYEKLVSDEKNVDYSGYQEKHIDQIHLRELMDGTTVSDTVLNDLLGAAVFYDLHDGKIIRERVNEPYYRIFRSGSVKVVSDENNYLPHVRKEEYDKFRALLDEAYKNYPECVCADFHYRLDDEHMYWLYARLFFLREENGHRHYFGSVIDISPLMKNKQSGQSAE